MSVTLRDFGVAPGVVSDETRRVNSARLRAALLVSNTYGTEVTSSESYVEAAVGPTDLLPASNGAQLAGIAALMGTLKATSEELRISVFPSAPDLPFCAFYIDAYTHKPNPVLERVTIETPADLTGECAGIYHQGNAADNKPDSLTLKRTKVIGGWNYGLRSNEGATTLEAEEYDLEGRTVPLAFWNNTNTGKRLHLRNGLTRGGQEGIYVSSSVSKRLLKHRSFNAVKHAVYTHGYQETIIPEYDEIVEGYVDVTCGHGYHTNELIRSKIHGCVLHNQNGRGVFLKNAAEVIGCEFDGGEAHVLSGANLAGKYIRLAGNTHRVTTIGPSQVAIGCDAGIWDIHDPRIVLDGVASHGIRVSHFGGSPAVVNIYGGGIERLNAPSWSSGITVGDGNIELNAYDFSYGRDCAFQWNVTAEFALARVRLVRNRWAGSDAVGDLYLINLTPAMLARLTEKDCEHSV